jgi:curved DNA-binding protein CbpA
VVLTRMECIDCCASQSAEDHDGGSLSRNKHPGARWTSQAINPYQVLELRRDATPTEIVQSYRKLALWHHPGRGGSSTPEERRRRLHFFEILSASYETLIHQESRRRYDVGLKQLERKRLAGLGVTSSSASHVTSDGSSSLPGSRNLSRLLTDRCPSSATSTLNTQTIQNRHHSLHRHVAKEEDAVPGLANSSSSETSTPSKARRQDALNKQQLAQSASSHSAADSRTSGCNFLCTPTLTETLSPNNIKSKSKSLIIGDSSASRSSADEAEIHFTERTVDRLFGGPLAPLHRARNFEPFTDPFDVFERVFGSPVFPRVTLEDETVVERPESNLGEKRNELALAVRSPWNHKAGWTGTAHKDKDGHTTVFISSRVYRDRKITRTETIHVDPETGKTTSEVKVEGENLLDESSEASDSGHDVTCEWITCPRKQKTNELDRGDTAALREGIHGVYGNAVEDFYQWNRDLYGACTGHMGCTD